jgi:hypothetical protein
MSEVIAKYGVDFQPLVCGKHSLNVALMRVTPEIAEAMLRGKENYRGVNRARGVNYQGAMMRDEWEVNAETIKLDSDFRCMDGQHRLLSCIESDTPFVSLVVVGVKSVLEVDRGKARNISDHFRHKGEINTNALAAIVGRLVRWEKTGQLSAVSEYGSAPTTAEADDFLRRHPDVRECVALARGVDKLARVSLVGSLCYAGTQVAGKPLGRAEVFCKGLQGGVENNHCDPRHVLREVLLRYRTTKERTAKAKLAAPEELAYLIKAWNLFLQGRAAASGNSIRWRSAGKHPQPFPVLITKDELV